MSRIRSRKTSNGTSPDEAPPPSPRLLAVRFDADDGPAVAEAVGALAEGHLIIIPTDTVYGLAAHPGVSGSEVRIYAAKERDRGKPIPLLAADLRDVESFGATLNDLERRLADGFWPGPLTLILSVGRTEEGFRVPACPVTRALLRAAGGVLRVTSANLSGEPPALDAAAAAAALGSAVRLVLDAGPAPGGTASSVVQVRDGRIALIRAGGVSSEALARVGGAPVVAGVESHG